MKILVTGAAGFIGSHLCERLLARGDSVTGIDNFDPFYDHRTKEANLSGFLHHDHFRFFQDDILDEEGLDRLWAAECTDLDAIVHLAAKAGVRPSIEDPAGYAMTNITGTLNILRRVSGMKNKPKFVFGSSSSVYGNNPTVPFCETDNVDNPISPYAATKKAAELICCTFSHLYGMDITALRFFTVYGPRQRPDLAIHKFTRRILGGESIDMYGDGSSRRDYTYIDDIIDGMVTAIDRCAGYEIINLGDSQPVTLRDMITTIENACGVKAVINQCDPMPGDVQQTYANIDKAGKLLDYSPRVSFEDGIKQFVNWIKQKPPAYDLT